jgi:hypothetical protein
MNDDRELDAWVLQVMQDELRSRQSKPDVVLNDTRGAAACETVNA